MTLISALIIGFVLLDGAARWLVITAGLLIELTEVRIMLRMSRRRRPVMGAASLIGRTAIAAGPCRPDGQVRIDGEIWAARCAAGCVAGERVRIISVDGLTLTVEPAEPPT